VVGLGEGCGARAGQGRRVKPDSRLYHVDGMTRWRKGGDDKAEVEMECSPVGEWSVRGITIRGPYKKST
jgi:hypothetical protein